MDDFVETSHDGHLESMVPGRDIQMHPEMARSSSELGSDTLEENAISFLSIEKEIGKRKDSISLNTNPLIRSTAPSIITDTDFEKEPQSRPIISEENLEQLNYQSNELLDGLGLRIAEDGYVKWKPNASSHPRNWSAGRKTFDTVLILSFDLFT
jgi:hypothetical protein